MITGTYGDPDAAGLIRGEITREEYDADPDLWDGVGSMAAFLAQGRD